MVKFDFEGESPQIMADLHSVRVYDLAERTLKWEHETLGPYSFCQSVLFAYARETIASVIQKGGFPEFILQPINFDAL